MKRARRWPLGSSWQTRVAANVGSSASPTMVPSVSFDFMASTEHRTAGQSSTHQRAANATVPGARGHGDASGRAAQFCQELPIDARLVFKHL